jgi:hypothetical protein
MSAGDYWRFRSENAKDQRPVTNSQKPALGGRSATVRILRAPDCLAGAENSNLKIVNRVKSAAIIKLWPIEQQSCSELTGFRV